MGRSMAVPLEPLPASERRACPTALAGHASDHRSPPNPVVWNWHSTPADAAFARELPNALDGYGKEVVFFQAQEGQVIGHGQACARSVGSVGATAVIYRSQPEKRSACFHFCADGFFLGGHPFVIPLMTARNDPRRAVLFGEVGNRQHELQASLATILRMPPERSGIVAMQGLKTLSRPDLYRLGHAQLDIGRDLDPIVPYPDMGGESAIPALPSRGTGVQCHFHGGVAFRQDPRGTSSLGAGEVRVHAAGVTPR